MQYETMSPIQKLVFENDEFDFISFDFDWRSKENRLSQHYLQTALIITSHPEIQKMIDEIRTRLKLKVVKYKYDSVKDFNRIRQTIFSSLSRYKLHNVHLKAKEITTKFNFQYIWVHNIQVYICTGRLPIDHEIDKIIFRPALPPLDLDKEIRKTKKFNKRERQAYDNEIIQEYIFERRNSEFPTIAIYENLNSKNELINYIDLNWEKIISPGLKNLPRRIYNQSNFDVFCLGIYLFKERQKNTSWDDIEFNLAEVEKVNPHLFPFNNPPSRIDLQKQLHEIKIKLRQVHPF